MSRDKVKPQLKGTGGEEVEVVVAGEISLSVFMVRRTLISSVLREF